MFATTRTCITHTHIPNRNSRQSRHSWRHTNSRRQWNYNGTGQNHTRQRGSSFPYLERASFNASTPNSGVPQP